MFFKMTKMETGRTSIFLNITRRNPTLFPIRPSEGRLKPPPHMIVRFQ